MRKYNCRVLTLMAVFLLVCILSPGPGSPTGKTKAFASLLAPIEGRTRLVIVKSRSTVTLFKGDNRIKTYGAVFGRGYREGDKQRMGDRRTPEGEFYICVMNNSERFYKFMGISYPGMKHAESGLRSGLISPADYRSIRRAIEDRQTPPWETGLGGAVGIHGRTRDAGNARDEFAGTNWTDGCVALHNADIDEIYSVVSPGTPVTILP